MISTDQAPVYPPGDDSDPLPQIGSMAFAVKWQIQHWGNNLKLGDVILSNAPGKFQSEMHDSVSGDYVLTLTDCGGTHLPDLTVITPIFDSEGKNIIFWTASRGHHADVSAKYINPEELWDANQL